MEYTQCGQSGLKLPRLSYGIWHAFDERSDPENSRALIRSAIDLGMVHLDAANVYGPPNGFAEKRLGEILKSDFPGYRDELLISTKAGYSMGPGPYGSGGSRKHILCSADQSLSRLGLDYVDIFYSHTPDENTPFEETAMAMADLVQAGKALYIGISNYDGPQTSRMAAALKAAGVPLLIHQVENSMLVPFKAAGVLPILPETGAGAIVFAPLAGGRLTEKYLNGIPSASRAAGEIYLKRSDITPEIIATVVALNALAVEGGRTLPELALLWAMRAEVVCSALIGASRPEQLVNNAGLLDRPPLHPDELGRIERILREHHGRPIDVTSD